MCAKHLVLAGDHPRAGLKASVVARCLLALLMLSLHPGVLASPLQPGEQLDYTFSYRGVFSGFVEIEIARASLTVAAQPVSVGGRPVYQAGLDLTTKPFAKAELIYPIRYHYRSWLEADRQTPLRVWEYLHTNKTEEELLWFDRVQGLGFRYHKSQGPVAPEARPPDSALQGMDSEPAQWALAEGAHRERLPAGEVWDYLSLLYRLRFGELEDGRSFDLPVYNGKTIKTYRTQVTRERLVWAGWDLPAFKLNLFEVRDGKRKGDSVTSIWISDDTRRRPLRFHVERGFGVFEGVLESGRPPTAQASDQPESGVKPGR